jgi:dTDP-4-amino-4,6-dideoxygalactose transaminase
VILPTFTFSATAHAVSWNGLRPSFVDIDPRTLTLDPAATRAAINRKTSAILAVHIYGTPCHVEELSDIATSNGLRLFFDAAHAFGSRRGDVPVGGFGDAEVFSLSPTKVLVAGEGGIISTNDDELAERCRVGRDYGNPGDYNCIFVGLNARMSEIHAATALASLDALEEQVGKRSLLADTYREHLDGTPGISFPEPRDGDRSTHKDFTILIDRESFGLGVEELAAALGAEGIDTRRYYSPLVHDMPAYASLRNGNGHLPESERAAASVLSLPMFGDLTEDQVSRVAEAIIRIRTGLA